ncbi:hypothetical protein OEZ77_25755 [Leclercia adecarboxylata]|nr:hypothetical protein [Leclercia adecarboxylata]MDC6689940.1 hypothetical protein [Leclercia adecarboxylata]
MRKEKEMKREEKGKKRQNGNKRMEKNEDKKEVVRKVKSRKIFKVN